MVDFKRTIKIQIALVFLYLAVLPLGQFAKIYADLIVGISAAVFLISKKRRIPGYRLSLKTFYFVILFSLVFSLHRFNLWEIYIGELYARRFISYSIFSLMIYNLVLVNNKLRDRIFDGLTLAILAVALLGWIQYLILPDLRFLYFYGWDDHYFRLVSTFLDPAFTGFILVVGFILAIARFLERRENKYLALGILFLVSTGFTYSRASYLAILAAVLVLVYFLKKSRRILVLAMCGFAGVVLLLPRPGGEGVRLERTASVFAKAVNLREGIEAWKSSPVFGIGFNNICVYKVNAGLADGASHSCGGLDNSFLLILATTGIVGFAAFGKFAVELVRGVGKDLYGRVFIAACAALVIHTLFTNTLFYSWVLGVFACLVGVSREVKRKS